jgi:hypothetical protein
MGVSGQRHAPAALYPWGKDPRHPLDRRLGDTAVLSKSMICKLVAKFCATGSVLDKKKTKKKRHILTEEKLAR